MLPVFTPPPPPSFISLLEYAEETLHCKSAFLFFDRSTPEDQRKQIIRSYRFLGFELLSPTHPQLPVKHDQYLFMAYELDPGGGGEGDNVGDERDPGGGGEG